MDDCGAMEFLIEHIKNSKTNNIFFESMKKSIK
jgi:transcription termination factor Rho